MKKLITAAVASAFAFLAMGAANAVELPSGTSLENLTAGEALDPTKNDSGTGSDSTYWFLAGDESAELLVTNYEASVELPPRPAQFADETNNNFLKIDTNGRLYRSIGVNDQSTDFPNPADIGDGIYLDTLVQFTAADDEFKDDALVSGDKIAIEYVEREAEYTNGVDQVTGEPTNLVAVAAMTNFVIRAGYIVDDYDTVPTNYYATVPVGFNKEKWHRLTVRAVASIAASGTQKAGFIVYLDGVALEYSADAECGVDFEPANAVAEYYKADCHAIYPSAVQSGDYQFNLSAVAFNGNGCVDDISFTDQTPGFIGRTVTFDLGTGDAVATLTVNGTDYDVAGVATTNIENLIESFTIAVTLADNYNISVISNAAGCTYTPTTPTSGTVTLTSASATVKVITTRNNFDYIDGEGQPRMAVTLSDALSKVGSGETIVLKFDYVAADWGESRVVYDIDGKEVTIDLHGNKIVGVVGPDDEDELFYVASGAALTIIDSVGGGEVSYATSYGIFCAEGDLSIGAATGDEGAIFNGRLFVTDGEGNVIRGNFDVANNGNSGSFLWEDYLGSDSTAALNSLETYWVVTPAGGSSDKPVAVPTALLGITYDGTEKTGVVAQVGFTLSGNTAVNAGTYEAIAMLQSGYVWSDDNTKTNKTISWSIAPDHTAVVDVTLASEIAEYSAQLEFPTASATIGGDAVVGTAAWSPDTITEPAAGATNTYTATFTVTEGNYAGSSGTAEFKVYKAAGGSTYPTYMPDDAAMKAKYDTWAGTYGADTGSAYETAFLLNIAPNATDQTLKAASITISGSTVTITANKALNTVNGNVYIKTAGTLAGLESASWGTATVDSTTGAIEMTSNGTAAFFKIKVDFAANNP